MKTQLIRAALVGLLGSLIMFMLIMFAIHGAGFAPFNVPPSAAFLIKMGLPAMPLGLLIHFAYGAFWSIILLVLFKNGVSLKRGLLLGFALWLFMMVVYSPIIGWGLFGLHGTPTLATTSPLYLHPGPKYMIATLILHLIYGGIIGGLNARWSIRAHSDSSKSA